jgi:hypothetical protein
MSVMDKQFLYVSCYAELCIEKEKRYSPIVKMRGQKFAPILNRQGQ